MARPWFRFYRKTVNNPKVQRLRPELFRAWINILCATDDDGTVPELKGCHTQARSLDELMARVKEAVLLCLEVGGESEEPSLRLVGIQRIAV